MNRILLLIAAATAALITTANPPATFTGNDDPATEDSLRQVINDRAATKEFKRNNKDVLKAETNDLFTLVNIIDNRLDNSYTEIRRLKGIEQAYRKLLTEDASIFTVELPAESSIPQCLKPHYATIAAVKKLLTETSELQENINNKSANAAGLYSDKSEKELIQMVAEIIEPSVMALGNHIIEFQKDDHPSLSPAQKEYFEKNVKDTYNAIVRKYFPSNE